MISAYGTLACAAAFIFSLLQRKMDVFRFLFLWELNEFRIVFVTNVSLQRKRIKTRKCDFYIRERSAALCAVCIDTFLHVFRSQLAHFDSLYIFGNLLPGGVVAIRDCLDMFLYSGRDSHIICKSSTVMFISVTGCSR